MLRRCLPVLALLAFSPLAAATGLDLNVNSNALRLTMDFEVSNNIIVDGSWLYHQDRGDVFGAGLHVTGAATGGRNPLQAGLGGRLLRVDSDVKGRDDGQVLPLGGFVSYTLPDYNRFAIGGSLYYAPDVLAFGDTNRYFEGNVWGAYSVLRNGQVYLGLRRVEAGFKNSPSVTFDTGIHAGLRLRF
jgi:hypothetical protein